MKTEIELPDDMIRNVLCCAFEGGIGYWVDKIDAELADGIELSEFSQGGARQPAGNYWHWSQLVPMVDGCAVAITVQDDPGKTFRLDCAALRAGLHVMATKYPRHFGDLFAGNEDATTGDVFVQCCIFGEVVYG